MPSSSSFELVASGYVISQIDPCSLGVCSGSHAGRGPILCGLSGPGGPDQQEALPHGGWGSDARARVFDQGGAPWRSILCSSSSASGTSFRGSLRAAFRTRLQAHRHYVGWTTRRQRHSQAQGSPAGRGSPLIRAAIEAGIEAPFATTYRSPVSGAAVEALAQDGSVLRDPSSAAAEPADREAPSWRSSHS